MTKPPNVTKDGRPLKLPQQLQLPGHTNGYGVQHHNVQWGKGLSSGQRAIMIWQTRQVAAGGFGPLGVAMEPERPDRSSPTWSVSFAAGKMLLPWR